MDVVWEILNAIGHGIVRMLIQPFFYIAILLIVLQYRRQILLERKLFSVKMHSLWHQVFRTFLGGLIAGVVVSIVMLFTGMTMTANGILLIWTVSLILILFRVRYLCLAYSIGALGIIQFIVHWTTASGMSGFWPTVLQTIRELNIPALLALVALLHLAEALLMRFQGSRFASPLFLAGKRGKLVGGHQMQSYWPIPLLLLIPAQTGSMLPWTPFFGGDVWNQGWLLMAFPVVVGFSEMTQSYLPKEKVRRSSNWLFMYSVILLVFAFGAGAWSPLTVVAALVGIGLHEWIYVNSRREEMERSPFYVHDQRGLQVLSVIPNTPAAELGIQSGEIIHKVNGVQVLTKEELHQALRINSAFCKLEVLNHAGESKFLQRAIFAGEHHQLGVILAPDEDAAHYVGLAPTSFFQLIRMKLGGVQSRMKM